MIIACPKCNAANPPDGIFCNQCAQALIQHKVPVASLNRQHVYIILIIIGAVILFCGGFIFLNRTARKDSPSDSVQSEKGRKELLVSKLNRAFSGTGARMTLTGENDDTVTVFYPGVTTEWISDFQNYPDIKSKLKNEGIAYMVFDNGTRQWKVSL